MSTYRVGHHQPQNIYRDEQYIGVMFTAEDAALAVEALNGDRTITHGRLEPNGPVIGSAARRLADVAADSCTCSPLPGGADPACPVHRGRRARGPKPPPLGPGCVCDGSGRTCPRHGAVM